MMFWAFLYAASGRNVMKLWEFCQDTLFGTAIKVHKCFDSNMPKLSESSLCCAFLRMQLVLRDHARVCKMTKSRKLNLSVIDDPDFLSVNSDFFCLIDIQKEIAIKAPYGQLGKHTVQQETETAALRWMSAENQCR